MTHGHERFYMTQALFDTVSLCQRPIKTQSRYATARCLYDTSFFVMLESYRACVI